MSFIDGQLLKFKKLFDDAITTRGLSGKTSLIRSSKPINLIHDAVKYELIQNGIDPRQIYPPFKDKKPEIKLAGYLKQKNQDVCVVPKNISKSSTIINWGPMSFLKNNDPYGYKFSDNSLVINVRSQMSSVAKNSDTIFERTFAEALNLHMRYKNMVLGDIFLIPTHEYDDDAAKLKQIGFKNHPTNIEKYISFFDSINNRPLGGPDYMYEKCALLIVDFNQAQPHLFKNSQELKTAGLISNNFNIEYETLGYDNFIKDLLKIYDSRYELNNLK